MCKHLQEVKSLELLKSTDYYNRIYYMPWWSKPAGAFFIMKMKGT